MNPNADSVETDRDERPSRTMPPEGSEGVLPLPTRDAFNTAIETEKPMRSGQSGLRGYEGTDGYAKRIKSYLRNNDVDTAADAAAPLSISEAREMLAAESEAASRCKAQDQ